MTAKTTHKRAKSKFDMTLMRKRIKKAFRKKYKKNISLSKIKAVWDDWVDIMITEPLVEYGEVNLDSVSKLEIVGERIIDNKRAFAIMSKGKFVNQRNGGLRLQKQLNSTRRGYIFGIKYTDRSNKFGEVKFIAERKIKQKVNYSLEKTNNYYRIKQ